MLRFLHGLWNQHRRQLDIELLWPECVRLSCGDMDIARYAFLTHARQDAAWQDLGEDHLRAVVDALDLTTTIPRKRWPP